MNKLDIHSSTYFSHSLPLPLRHLHKHITLNYLNLSLLTGAFIYFTLYVWYVSRNTFHKLLRLFVSFVQCIQILIVSWKNDDEKNESALYLQTAANCESVRMLSWTTWTPHADTLIPPLVTVDLFTAVSSVASSGTPSASSSSACVLSHTLQWRALTIFHSSTRSL